MYSSGNNYIYRLYYEKKRNKTSKIEKKFRLSANCFLIQVFNTSSDRYGCDYLTGI